MDVRVGLWRKLSAEELMLLKCGVGEDSWESLGLQGHPTSPSYRRSVLNIHWKDWCWSWNSNTLATYVKSWLIWKDPNAGKDWGQEEKGLDGITDSMDMGLVGLRELVMDREAWRAAVHGVAKSWTRLSDWTELSPQQATADWHLHRRPSNTHRQVLLWSHCSFPLSPGVHTVLLVPSKSLCFSQSWGSSIIKALSPSKSDSLGIPNWKNWCGSKNLCKNVRTSLALLFSSLWVAQPLGMGFNFNMIALLVLSHCSSFLSLVVGIFFWWVPTSSSCCLFSK